MVFRSPAICKNEKQEFRETLDMGHGMVTMEITRFDLAESSFNRIGGTCLRSQGRFLELEEGPKRISSSCFRRDTLLQEIFT
jgi:hypothetical protein